MKITLKIFFLALLVYFGSWFIVYKLGVNNLSIQSEDTIPSLFLPLSILKEKTLFLDSYYSMMIEKYPQPDDKSYEKGLTPFYLRKVIDRDGEEHYVSAFPLVSGLVALPVYLVPILLNHQLSWESLAILGHLTGAIVMALSGAILYLIVRNNFLDKRKSLLLTGIYLFGTINFALLSQAIWQHGIVQFFSLLAVYYLLDFQRNFKSHALYLFGFFSILAVLTRPTALAMFCLLPLMIFFREKRLDFEDKFLNFLKIGVGALPGILFFLWYNNKYYFDLSNQGYADQLGNSWLGRFPEGFLGLWMSPSKGILVYSPVFIFIFVSLWIIYKRKTFKKDIFYILSLIVVVAHTLVLGKWKHWYGGWSYGYRMASDILPFLIFLLIPFVESKFYEKFKKSFYTLFAISVLFEIHGIIFFDGIWHAAYDDGFVNTKWLWSLKNCELAFNMRRVLVKFGLMYQACPKCSPN